MKFYHASLDTQHWRFDAYETDESLARTAMRLAMTRHAKQCEISPKKFLEDYFEEVNVQEVKMGAAYRDGVYLR